VTLTVVYGWRESDIEVVAEALRQAFTIEWQGRHSLYLGDYFLWPPVPAEPTEESEQTRLELQVNFFDEIDQELAYPEWPEHLVLLHATGLDPDWVERLKATGAEVLDDDGAPAGM
jgi:hypothetical protein